MKLKLPKTRIGRNAPCPCGSGLKYKKCCNGKKEPAAADLSAQYLRKYNIRLKTPPQIEGIRRAGALTIATLDAVEAALHAGMRTDEINTLVHQFTLDHGAVPAPLNYRGFPKSVCVSVNDVICHGIPGERILVDGDIVNVDVTPILDGYFADANKTFFIGTPAAEALKIVGVTRECLRQGLSMIRPGNRVGDIGWAIQNHAESQGCSVVQEFVGHGVGLEFHEPPQIFHYGRQGQGIELVPGMVFTVEPMINLGERHLEVLADNWTAVTRDGSLSAQFEQTVRVTESGYESLTPFDLRPPR